MTDLVVISLEAWDQVWRRNQYLVAGLLRRDPSLRVLFVEPAADPVHELVSCRRPRRGSGLRAVTDLPGVGRGQLWRYQPTKLLPRRLDPRSDVRIARSIKSRVSALGFRSPVLWVNDPGGAAVLRVTGWAALYDVTDDWLEAERTPREHQRLREDEATLLTRCQEVVVCSDALALSKGTARPVTLVRNAVDLERYRAPAPRPVDLPTGRVVLYMGTVHTDRIDVDLCARTAELLGHTSRLVLVGPAPLQPADRERLRRSGVLILGPRPAADVPAYLQHADVLVVPHVVTAFTDSLDPIKRYEYRAVGRPVVSTPVAGFRDVVDDKVTVAPENEFPSTVMRVLESAQSLPARPTDSVPTWDDRVAEMREVIDRVWRSATRP